MKTNIKLWWRTKWNYVLGILLAQLGMTSCLDDIIGGSNDIVVAYGTPHADFKISLTVKDEVGKPLPNQKVVIRQLSIYSQPYEQTYKPHAGDTVVTDLYGKYTGGLPHIHTHNGNIRAVVNDPVDESLSPDSVNIELKQTKKGDGSWFQGEFSGSAEITLKKK